VLASEMRFQKYDPEVLVTDVIKIVTSVEVIFV
jgi:hypothetical protein